MTIPLRVSFEYKAFCVKVLLIVNGKSYILIGTMNESYYTRSLKFIYLTFFLLKALLLFPVVHQLLSVRLLCPLQDFQDQIEPAKLSYLVLTSPEINNRQYIMSP